MKSVFDRAQKRFTTGQFVIALGALFLGIVGISYAVSVPNIFTSGAVISSSEVNANFTALKVAVDALETKVNTLGSNIPLPSRLGKTGYAWANDGAAATYTPNSTYSFNSSGGATTATRSGPGVYTMTFSGLGSNTGLIIILGGISPIIGFGEIGGHVQVTAYPPAVYCRTTGWSSTGADASISVACFNSVGGAVDSPYNVLFVM